MTFIYLTQITIIYLSFRNLFAEKAVTFMSLPCEFRTYGCKVEIQYNDKELASFDNFFKFGIFPKLYSFSMSVLASIDPTFAPTLSVITSLHLEP